MTDPKDGSAEELLELKRALYHGSSGPPTRGSLILSKKTVAFRGEALDCAWDLASVSAEPFAVYFADGATTRPGMALVGPRLPSADEARAAKDMASIHFRRRTEMAEEAVAAMAAAAPAPDDAEAERHAFTHESARALDAIRGAVADAHSEAAPRTAVWTACCCCRLFGGGRGRGRVHVGDDTAEEPLLKQV